MKHKAVTVGEGRGTGHPKPMWAVAVVDTPVLALVLCKAQRGEISPPSSALDRAAIWQGCCPEAAGSRAAGGERRKNCPLSKGFPRVFPPEKPQVPAPVPLSLQAAATTPGGNERQLTGKCVVSVKWLI